MIIAIILIIINLRYLKCCFTPGEINLAEINNNDKEKYRERRYSFLLISELLTTGKEDTTALKPKKCHSVNNYIARWTLSNTRAIMTWMENIFNVLPETLYTTQQNKLKTTQQNKLNIIQHLLLNLIRKK